MSNGDLWRQVNFDPRPSSGIPWDGALRGICAGVGLGAMAANAALFLATLMVDEIPAVWPAVAVAVVAAVVGRLMYAADHGNDIRAAGLGLIVGPAAGIVVGLFLLAILLAKIGEV